MMPRAPIDSADEANSGLENKPRPRKTSPLVPSPSTERGWIADRREGGEVSRPSVLFCDFDGTITMEELIVQVWKRFGRPGWRERMEAMLAQRLTLREGVAANFADIPSSEKAAIIEHAKRVVQIRPGFPELLRFCKDSGIDFVVASGGIDFFVRPVMEPYLPLVSRLYTIGADFTGEHIRLAHTHACESCGLCKGKVMAEYPGAYRILAGDGITDLHGARQADLVFARGQLQRLLRDEGRPCVPFETFHDVVEGLAKRLSGDQPLPPPRGEVGMGGLS